MNTLSYIRNDSTEFMSESDGTLGTGNRMRLFGNENRSRGVFMEVFMDLIC